jgi:hypothetical protein
LQAFFHGRSGSQWSDPKQDAAAGTVGEFFGGLAERGREPLLQHVSGTLRFDLADGERVEH